MLPAPFNPKDEGVPLRRSRDLPKPHRVPEGPTNGVPPGAAAAFAFVDVPQGRRNSRRWRSGRVPRRSAPGPQAQPAWSED